MKILVLGGTRFVGRHIVEAFLHAEHAVTILTRGQSPDELPAVLERLHGDRHLGAAGLQALEGRAWDACVDVSGYTPAQVRASAQALHGRVGRYVFISTVSVYAEQDRHPIVEDDPLLPAAAEDVQEVTPESYGPLKVACERVVREVYGEDSAVLRPQLIAGPFDHTARTTYWPDRAARGGVILAPGDGSDGVQVIDARDLARFTVRVCESALSGVFNVAGPRLTWQEFMHELGAGQVVWIGVPEMAALGLGGFGDFPLFIPLDNAQSGLMHVSNERAVMAGLTLTDPEVTARDTRVWSATHPRTYALTPEREAQTLAALRDRSR